MTYAVVLHGGAGARRGTDYTDQKRHMAELIASGQDMLATGGNAIDVVTVLVRAMESSGLYVAGKGSAPNRAGIVELDASVMDGRTRAAGAVAAVSNIAHPIDAARRVMEDGRHVLLCGDGARSFALAHGIDTIADPAAYYTDHVSHGSGETTTGHGTVGAVALDLSGGLAAATSTGGTFNKYPGRIGDTAMIGAGTWADEQVAVSCTGIGEAFIRSAAAYDVAARVRYGQVPLDVSARAVLDEVRRCDGDGGLIAVDNAGRIAMPFNSQGMKRAAASSAMAPVVRVFETED